MKIVRTFIERLGRGRLLKRKITVNQQRVTLYVSPDAQLKYLKLGPKAFDRELIYIAEKYLDISSNVWDVGANVGVFSFAAATVASEGRVLSIEADIWLARILNKTMRMKEHTDSNVSILPVAISNRNGIASFLIASRGRASNALESVGGRSQMGGIREKRYVPTLTLDTLLEHFSAPDFIKIDVEGAELLVLEGASRVIDEIRPTFYIEVDHQSSASIMALLRSANYQILDQKGDSIQQSHTYNNVLFVPQEKMTTTKKGR